MRFFSLFLIIGLCAGTPAYTQSSMEPSPRSVTRVGLYGSPGFNFYSGTFQVFEGSKVCGTFTSGNGTGLVLGGLLEIPIQRNLLLEGRVGYHDASGQYDTDTRLGTVIMPDGTLRDAFVNHVLDATISYVTAGVAVQYFPFSNLDLHFAAGPTIGIGLKHTFIQNEKLLEPLEAKFIDDTREHVVASGDIASFKNVSLTMDAGAGYDIRLTRNLIATPEVRYRFPVTSVTTDTDWKIAGLQAGLSLKWAFLPPPPPPPAPPPPPPPPKKVFKPLVVSVEYRGIRNDGSEAPISEIVIDEIRTSDRYPLLPYIFFDQGSSEITGQHLLTPAEAATFDVSAIKGDNISVYREALNVLGYRMKEQPDTRITLTGTNNGVGKERGNRRLSRARAEAVKSYLVKTWGIDPRRIRVVARNLPKNPTSRSTPEGQAENRRVEITSRDGRVLAPTTRNEIERRYNVAGIALYPVITAQAGLANWSLTMRHGQNIVMDTSGTRTVPQRLAWTIVPEEFEKEPSARSLAVSVSATDVDGQKKLARLDIPVKHLTVEKKRTQRIGDKIIARSRLIVFEFDKATLSPQNRKIIEEVRKQMTPDTKVQIVGYTDRLGDPKHNLELSLRRAEAVRKALGPIIPDTNVTVKGLGSSVLLFDNSTPEGRFYCRMVEIIAETPVKN